MATHAIKTGHEFPDITNVTLIKHVPHKGTIMNIWENLQIYKHKTQNRLIPEQIQINTKHDTIFKALNIENTQNTKTDTTTTHKDVYKRQT